MEDKENHSDSSYKDAVKSTTILGSVQVVQMLVIILRSKIIALILGPAGMGVYSIFQSVAASVGQVSSLGVYQSAVRDISQALEKGEGLDRILAIVKSLVLIIGLLGLLVCIISAPWINRFMFDSEDYTWWFVILGVGMFFYALSQGATTILQGCRQLRPLSKTSLYSAVASLVVSVPLYYVWGVHGIVPSIVIGYFVSYLIGLFYVSKIPHESVKMTVGLFKANLKDGLPIVKLGIVLVVNSSILTLSVLFLNAFISNYGTIDDVGYNQAAFGIVNQALIVVIAVLASDYYPRLAGAVSAGAAKVKMIVDAQLELAVIIIAPISIFLIIFAPYLVRILLSSQFMEAVPLMIQWMSVALLFRCSRIVLAYVVLAKGDKKIFLLFDAIIGNGTSFLLSILAYYFWGLTGVAIAYTASSIANSLLFVLLMRKKYNILLNKRLIFTLLFYIVLVVGVFLVSTNIEQRWYVMAGEVVVLALSIAYSAYILQKRTQLLSKIKSMILKK